MRKISYSYLHVLSCPYASFLKYEGHIKGKTTHYLALGNAVHLALEHMYSDVEEGQLPIDDTLEIFRTEFDRIIDEEEVFVSYPQLKKAQADGSLMIERYYSENNPRPLAVEKEFSLVIEDVEIVGKIDKAEIINDEFIVTDYKSGSGKPTEWFLSRDLQFTTYYWAAQQLFGRFPDRLVWHHLKTGARYPTYRSEWDIEQLKNIVRGSVTLQNQDIRYRVYHKEICGQCEYSGDKGKECDDQLLEEKILAMRNQ